MSTDPVICYADNNRLIVYCTIEHDTTTRSCLIDVTLVDTPSKLPSTGMVQLNKIHYLLDPSGDFKTLADHQLREGGWAHLGNNYHDIDDIDIDDSEVNVLLVNNYDDKELLVSFIDMIVENNLNVIGNTDYLLDFAKIDYLE